MHAFRIRHTYLTEIDLLAISAFHEEVKVVLDIIPGIATYQTR
jgi:hypothetical protein